MNEDTILSANVTIKAPIPDICSLRQLRAYKGALGVSDEVALRLDPPPLPSWLTYTVGGVTIATAGAGGVFGLLAQGAQREYDQYAEQSIDNEISGKKLKKKGNRLEDRVLYANSLFIAAGALALTTAIMALFTDWWGYGDAE